MTEKDILENNPTLDKLKSQFGGEILKTEIFQNQLAVIVRRDRILELMKYLKEDADLSYDFLVDITAVDYLNLEKSPRFQVVYHLRSTKYGRRVRIKVPLSENDCKIATMSGLWKTANWLERETCEMYGIVFEDHPDPRKLLLPETYQYYPLRKDYPLRGKGEREIILPEGS
jgi:NADH-quinone oxidoreductase subunit C